MKKYIALSFILYSLAQSNLCNPQEQTTQHYRKPKIVGLMAVRNEQNFLEQHLHALSLFTDAIVIVDDASTDNTLEIIKNVSEKYNIDYIITKKKWYRDEPADRNAMLEAGRRIGGTHFICIDADEMFTSNFLHNNYLRQLIVGLQPGDRLCLAWIQFWRNTHQYRFDQSMWTNHYKDFIFCDDGTCCYQSEFIHTPRCPQNLSGKNYYVPGYEYGLLHFQFVNWRNVIVKHAWYRCLERIREPRKSSKEINERYAPSINEQNLGLKDAPEEWLAGYSFFDKTVYDRAEEWREEQVYQWFQEYGTGYFKDLDIWNIDWNL